MRTVFARKSKGKRRNFQQASCRRHSAGKSPRIDRNTLDGHLVEPVCPIFTHEDFTFFLSCLSIISLFMVLLLWIVPRYPWAIFLSLKFFSRIFLIFCCTCYNLALSSMQFLYLFTYIFITEILYIFYSLFFFYRCPVLLFSKNSLLEPLLSTTFYCWNFILGRCIIFSLFVAHKSYRWPILFLRSKFKSRHTHHLVRA